MDFSIFNSLHNLILSILNFFDNNKKEINLEFKDKNGNHVMRKIPTIGLLKQEIEKELEKKLNDNIAIFKNFSKINNHFFDGKIDFKYNKKNKKIDIEATGIAKLNDIININCKTELELDFNYNNYLYFDIQDQTLKILNKPFKIGFSPEYLIVSKNIRFNKSIDIFTNYKEYYNDVIQFFNSYLNGVSRKYINIDFSHYSGIKNDYFEIGFKFDKFININKFLIETNFTGTFQILASTNNKIYHKIYTTKFTELKFKNISQIFSNVDYYKYYKIRFYNDNDQLKFTIRNLNLLTDNIVWLDTNDNITKIIIDDIPIQKKILYLGEFKKQKNDIIFYPYCTSNIFRTDFEKYVFNFCIDNPFKDENIDIDIYISENKLGTIKEKGTKYFKILYNSEKIEVILHPDSYINLTDFYIQLEIKRRDYEYFRT